MARRQQRNRRTSTTDKTQKDPVVIQQKPEPEVVEAIRAIPEEERVAVPVPAKAKAEVVEEKDTLPAEGKYGALSFFKEEFIDELAKVPSDLLGYLNNQEKAYKAMRATNRPGDDERAAKLLARLNELRRVVRGMGYTV